MKNVQIITTNEAKQQYWETMEIAAEKVEDGMHVINVLSDVKYQTFRGFGIRKSRFIRSWNFCLGS